MMFTLDIPFAHVATTYQAHVEHIKARLDAFAQDGDADQPIDENIVAVARLLDSLSRAHVQSDFAFGDDGSIGVHVVRTDREEYLDFLNDGRIRYYSTSADGNRFGQIVPSERADAFLHVYCTATMQFSFDLEKLWIATIFNASSQVVA